MFQFPPGRHKVLVRAQKHVEPYKRYTSFSHTLPGGELLFVLVVCGRRIERGKHQQECCLLCLCESQSFTWCCCTSSNFPPEAMVSANMAHLSLSISSCCISTPSSWRPQQAQNPDFVILLVSAHSTFEVGHYKPPCIYSALYCNSHFFGAVTTVVRNTELSF